MTSSGSRRSALKIGIVVSGLPASGKTQIGRQLARALDYAFLDKDDFLEDLYDQSLVASLDDRDRAARSRGVSRRSASACRPRGAGFCAVGPLA